MTLPPHALISVYELRRRELIPESCFGVPGLWSNRARPKLEDDYFDSTVKMIATLRHLPLLLVVAVVVAAIVGSIVLQLRTRTK